MKAKLIYIGAVLLLVFASANATSRSASTKQPPIKTFYMPQENGDYRLFIFNTDRSLICEEKEITVAQQGDAVNPIVLQCKH